MNPIPTKSSLRIRKAVLWLAFLPLLAAAAARPAQVTAPEKERQNPFHGNTDAINSGRSIFRMNCAVCHGIDARGGRGPDLTAGWRRGDSDAAVFATIMNGVPGTEMPPTYLQSNEVWMVVAFLRSLTAAPRAAATGDREAGRTFFFGEGLCSQCHMVQGKGGRLGPDLSRVGARAAAYLTESIRDPGKEILGGYETVSVLTKDGRRLTGVRKNEDTFSLQLMDAREDLHLFLKKDLREVVSERKSLMPAYDERTLDEKRLQDLLAYLTSLRDP